MKTKLRRILYLWRPNATSWFFGNEWKWVREPTTLAWATEPGYWTEDAVTRRKLAKLAGEFYR
jgi:hypothetical protein